MTFHGTPKWAHADGHAAGAHGHDAHGHDDHASAAQIETHDEPLDGHDDHGPLNPHESPPVMLIPLLLLALGAVAAGFTFAPEFIGEGRDAFWKGAIFDRGPSMLVDPD